MRENIIVFIFFMVFGILCAMSGYVLSEERRIEIAPMKDEDKSDGKLYIGDEIKCHDVREAKRIIKALKKEGLIADFDLDRDGVWLIITGIVEGKDERKEHKRTRRGNK